MTSACARAGAPARTRQRSDQASRSGHARRASVSSAHQPAPPRIACSRRPHALSPAASRPPPLARDGRGAGRRALRDRLGALLGPLVRELPRRREARGEPRPVEVPARRSRSPDAALRKVAKRASRTGTMPPAKAPQPPRDRRRRRCCGAWTRRSRAESRPSPGRVDDPPPQPLRVPQHDPRPARRRVARPTTSRSTTSATASTTSATSSACSPLLLEKYAAAAEEIAARRDPGRRPGPARRTPHRRPRRSALDAGLRPRRRPRVLYNDGDGLTSVVRCRATGDYLLRVRAFGDQAGPEPRGCASASTARRGARRREEVAATKDAPAEYEARCGSDRGTHKIAVAFTNDFYDPTTATPRSATATSSSSGSRSSARSTASSRRRRTAQIFAPTRAAADAGRAPPRDPRAVPAPRVAPPARRRGDRRASSSSATGAIASGGARSSAASSSPSRRRSSSPHFLFRVEPDPPGAAPGARAT